MAFFARAATRMPARLRQPSSRDTCRKRFATSVADMDLLAGAWEEGRQTSQGGRATWRLRMSMPMLNRARTWHPLPPACPAPCPPPGPRPASAVTHAASPLLSHSPKHSAITSPLHGHGTPRQLACPPHKLCSGMAETGVVVTGPGICVQEALGTGTALHGDGRSDMGRCWTGRRDIHFHKHTGCAASLGKPEERQGQPTYLQTSPPDLRAARHHAPLPPSTSYHANLAMPPHALNTAGCHLNLPGMDAYG